jgi:hypothetical protein
MKFGETPDYDQLIQMFESFQFEHNFKNDDKFDWVLKRAKLLEEKAEQDREKARLEQLSKSKPGMIDAKKFDEY